LESLPEKGADLQANRGTIFFLEFSQHNQSKIAFSPSDLCRFSKAVGGLKLCHQHALKDLKIALSIIVCALPTALEAQFNFTVYGRQLQVYSFASQGFLLSDNNYMTTDSRQGSFRLPTAA
jgi:hypothetical protein